MKRIDDETRAKIVDMYAHGKLHREIHEETGVGMGTISNICRAAGLDKVHVGGKMAKAIPHVPDLPEPSIKPDGLLMVTARTLKLRGFATGCDYTAGTEMSNIDITLGDWALSIDVDKLDGFISELQQVKNSLGIRVIDHDRADDVRDTTSLSGGETFIVSLGLALGLSALSSRNISFENLFIDEGFGTLDHDTLETVINSLAMLQSSQGKKVGVISHTDTMSRITTQIRVIRNGSSGSSHIEIYP